jgi:hypothetical protein
VRCSGSSECASELALNDVEGFTQNRLFFSGVGLFSVHSVLLDWLLLMKDSGFLDCANRLTLDDVEGFAQNRLFLGGVGLLSIHDVLLNE